MSDQQTPAYSPDDAQGLEPQGAGQGTEQSSQEQGLYDLSTAPEELRPFLEAEMKKMEANATRKFQEGAEARKQLEQFERLGISEVPPEELEALLGFRDIVSDPEQFESWWEAVGTQQGWLDPEDGGAEAADPEDPDDPTQALLDRIEELEQRLTPFEEQSQEQQHQAAVQAEMEAIQNRISELDPDGQYDPQRIAQLAMAYGDDPDAIDKGFADLQAILGEGERGLIESKMQQPGAAVRGGVPNGHVEPPKSFTEARDIARSRLQAARQQ